MPRRRVSFIISARNKGFIKALDQSQRRLKRFGFKMERMGRTLTRNITVPVGIAGGAAIKMASDFESSLAQARAQADLTAKQVAFIGDSAKDTAKRTGESTDDIIEAYKFTLSAGKDLAESQEIVEAAAEAAAAGFGEQRDLVRTATTAMEAYSDRLDSGRQFMDLLVGSGQKMELEVDKLSGAMQRNVGVAKELGIGLDELLAGIGSVSEIMGDAQRGGRLFQTMITNLLNPTAEAREAIEEVFGSVRELHRSIREEGLLNTMVRLRSELEKNHDEGLGLVFAQRSLEAALNFTNREGARTNEILGNMGDTAGSTRSAFDDVSESTEKRFKKALRSVQVAAIELGTTLLPLVNDLLETVDKWVTSFSKLDKQTQQNIIRFTAMTAAIGPLLIVSGKAIKILASLTGKVAALATALKTGTALMWGYVGAIAALGVAGFKANQRSQDRIDSISDEVKELETYQQANSRIIVLERKREKLQRQIAKGARGLGKELEDLNQELEETIDWRDKLALDAMNEATKEAEKNAGKIEQASQKTQKAISDISIGRIGSISTPNVEIPTGELQRARGAPDSIEDAMRTFRATEGMFNQFALAIVEKHNIAIDEMTARQVNAINIVTSMANTFVQSFGQGMTNLIVQGGKLVDILGNIGRLLASSAIQKGLSILLTGGLVGGGFFGIGGGILGGLFGGLFASGGRPPTNKVSIVGERGPELFVPSSAGTIIPNLTMRPAPNNMSVNLSGDFRVKGTDLVLSLERANQLINR